MFSSLDYTTQYKHPPLGGKESKLILSASSSLLAGLPVWVFSTWNWGLTYETVIRNQHLWKAGRRVRIRRDWGWNNASLAKPSPTWGALESVFSQRADQEWPRHLGLYKYLLLGTTVAQTILGRTTPEKTGLAVEGCNAGDVELCVLPKLLVPRKQTFSWKQSRFYISTRFLGT